MALNVVLALVSGVFLGGIFVFWLFRHGLTVSEWLYFREFLYALRCGEYDEVSDDERSEKDGED